MGRKTSSLIPEVVPLAEDAAAVDVEMDGVAVEMDVVAVEADVAIIAEEEVVVVAAVEGAGGSTVVVVVDEEAVEEDVARKRLSISECSFELRFVYPSLTEYGKANSETGQEKPHHQTQRSPT